MKHRRRLVRIAIWSAAGLLGLVLLLAAAAALLLGTQGGTRFLFARLGALMPGSFEVAALEGPIRGPLTIHGLTYKREGMQVKIDRLHLEWRLHGLLERRLDIQRLYADGVHIVTTPTPNQQPAARLPDLNLHFNIIVRDARVRGITLASADGPPSLIDEIDLVTSDIHNLVRIDRLAVRSALLRAQVSGTVQPLGDYPVDLAAQWAVHPAGMAEVAGGGTLRGTLEKLDVAQAVTAPFALRVAAVLGTPMRDLHFDGRIGFAQVNPRRLKADLPDLAATGEVAARGTLESFTSWGTLRGAVDPAGAVGVTYNVTRQGDNWQIVHADVDLPGTPTRLSLGGRLRLAGHNVDLDGSASWHDLAWPPRGKASYRSAQGNLRLTAHGTGEALASQGSLRAAFEPLGALAADYRLARRGAEWRLEQAEISVPGKPTRLSLAGRFAQKGQQLDLDATAHWHELVWPLTGAPSVRSREGQAKVAGNLDGYRAEIAADFIGANPAAQGQGGSPAGQTAAASSAAGAAPAVAATTGAPGGTAASAIPATAPAAGSASATAAAAAAPAAVAGRLTLVGLGDKQRFRIEALDASLRNGHLHGQGQVAWSPRLRWDLALSGQGLDPAVLRPDLPGSLSLTASTQGEMQPAGPSGRIDLTQLRGTLRQQPLQASAALRLQGARYDLGHLDLQWGGARIKASGQLGDRNDLGFDAAIPNVGLLDSSLAGAVVTRGRFSGTTAAPHVKATATVDGLRSGDQSVAHATISADVDLATGGAFQVDTDAATVVGGGETIKTLTVHSRGAVGQHTLAISAVGFGERPDNRLDVALAGGLAGALGPRSTWRGQLTRLDLHSQPVGDWALKSPATLEAGAGDLELRGFCWRATGNAGGGAAGAEAAQLCAGAGWSKDGPWAAEADLTALPLNLLRPLLPSDVTLTGVITGTARANGGSQGIAAAHLDLKPGPGELSYPTAEGRTTSFHFEQGAISAQAGPAGGTANANLSLTGIGTLGAQLRLPRLTQGVVLKDQPLAGTVALHFNDLAFVEGLAPEVKNAGGSLGADFRLAGTLGAPRLQGEARLQGGHAQVPSYGLDLKEIQLTVTGDGSGPLAIEASARSGPGSVRISGQAALAPTPAAPVRLAITGRRFQVMGTRDIRIQVDPDLKLTYSGTAAQLTGELQVPDAYIEVNKKKPSAVTPSPDVVLVGGTGPQVQQPGRSTTAISARVRIVLVKDGLDINTFGLKGRPSGSLLAIEEPGRPTTGVGELTIDQGTFQAYGQDLTINTGRIIFGGPIDNPGINVRASRTAADGTVAGIQAKGTLKAPEVTLWSQPQMSESDALAYMMLGHPLGQSTTKEGSLVANAATALGLKGGTLLAKKIGSRFGLEEASIESKSGSLNQASLVLGKYLSPHLYVAYGVGLFQPVNTFRIRYILSSNWTLQAENAAGTSADILYTLER
ncbi:MAG TPA: translocation/assembly module TamB domain-containing protein [Thermoanaerobaculia bacterium]|nr:translocation/assembly module TamB domain-containing protein [Thermoanaerobaculia bacterium]